MPAVAVTQRDQVILSRNRLKGCVGASFRFSSKNLGTNLGVTFYLWKWNIMEDVGIVNVVGQNLKILIGIPVW